MTAWLDGNTAAFNFDKFLLLNMSHANMAICEHKHMNWSCSVTTGNLNKAVKRNSKRFPDDFMFRLSKQEFDNLIFHYGTSSWGGTRKLPNAFTEQGVAMLSSVLHSDRAIKMNIQIIRVFTRTRQLLETHSEILKKLEKIERNDIEQDKKILLIFEYLKQLEQDRKQRDDQTGRKRIGFKPD